jgi:two-component system, chemotaxis family, chemotaxis protein CheY
VVGAGPILAVDDDEGIRGFVQMALEDEGYGVLLARDGVEALELLERTRPELILLDMRMPQMNGWQFIEAYRQAFESHAPIVVMTAGRDAAQAASQVGASGHLAKPFDLHDLIALVERYVPGPL